MAGTGVSLGNRLVLRLMQVTVGSVRIPMLYRTSPKVGVPSAPTGGLAR